MSLESTWNKFNELKTLAAIETPSVADKEKCYKLITELQNKAEINYNIAQGKTSDLNALEKLRSNEKYLTDKLLDSEAERRASRNCAIAGLVLLNACQMVAVIYFLIHRV